MSRVYCGNLPPEVPKGDVEAAFKRYGTLNVSARFAGALPRRSAWQLVCTRETCPGFAARLRPDA